MMHSDSCEFAIERIGTRVELKSDIVCRAGWNFFFYEALLIPFEIVALCQVRPLSVSGSKGIWLTMVFRSSLSGEMISQLLP